MTLSDAALEDLRSAFGADFGCHRHNVYAAVAVQIDTANVAGEIAPRRGHVIPRGSAPRPSLG